MPEKLVEQLIPVADLIIVKEFSIGCTEDGRVFAFQVNDLNFGVTHKQLDMMLDDMLKARDRGRLLRGS